MSQSLLPFADENPECTCKPTCGEFCMGECGCQYCWDQDSVECNICDRQVNQVKLRPGGAVKCKEYGCPFKRVRT